MRAGWSGAITFGLVNVPVKAYSAVQNHDVSFHQIHDADGGRIRYQRRCEVCGQQVDPIMLVLQSMRWADEVREVDFPAATSRAKLGRKELKLSAALVEQFASDFTPDEFEDEYQVELRKFIEAKLEQDESIETEATFGNLDEDAEKDTGGGESDGDDEDAEVIDLMEALESSLDRRRGGAAKGRAVTLADTWRGSSAGCVAVSGGADDEGAVGGFDDVVGDGVELVDLHHAGSGGRGVRGAGSCRGCCGRWKRWLGCR